MTTLWIAFGAIIALALLIDLGMMHRKAHTIPLREAALISGAWLVIAMLYATGVFMVRGKETGIEFLTGYVIELSLSVDNVFLFAVLFTYFQIPTKYQHRVLSWGVLSAVVMRGAMIAAGDALLDRFHWIIYVFGVFLILTGIKMFLHRNEEAHPENNGLVRWLRSRVPLTEEYDGQKFFTHVDGKRLATPLFFVLALIELTDLMFALDSIPAIFAITDDAFVVFTSNIFAIMGLRALYFLLAGVMDLFVYLPIGLSAVLVFVGGKMLAEAWNIEIPILYSLLIIASILAIAIFASLAKARRDRQTPAPL